MQCGDSCWHRGVSRTSTSHSERNMCRHCHGYGGTSNAHLLCTRLGLGSSSRVCRARPSDFSAALGSSACCDSNYLFLSQTGKSSVKQLVGANPGWVFHTFFGFGMEILRRLLGITGSPFYWSNFPTPRWWRFCEFCFAQTSVERKTCSQFTKMWSLGAIRCLKWHRCFFAKLCLFGPFRWHFRNIFDVKRW